MNLLRRLHFNFSYIFHRAPWDSGISPPELVEFIHTNPSGRAIDLGCGTGTNAITLARSGWNVTGVDFSEIAIERARQKAGAAKQEITFLVNDVIRLPEAIGPFDLVLDIGCFHGIALNLWPAYLNTISRILVPGGTWLLYAMRSRQDDPSFGLSESDISQLASRLLLRRREDGSDPTGRQSSWFWFVRE